MGAKYCIRYEYSPLVTGVEDIYLHTTWEYIKARVKYRGRIICITKWF